MNRRKMMLLLAVVLLAALVLRLLLSSPPSTTATPLPREETKQGEQAQSTDQSGLPQPIFKERPSGEILQQKIEEGPRGQIAQMLEYAAAFNTPINFWGKVLDEKGQPVSGAVVKLGVSDQPLKTGTQYERVTDAYGLFSITGAKGLSLSVNISKDDYYQTDRSRGHASYYHPSENKEPLPTSDKPAIFELRKMGEAVPLIVMSSRQIDISPTGQPANIDLATGRTNQGELQIASWLGDATKRPFDWHYQLSIPNGGFAERSGQFDFEAPEHGYQPTVEINMPSTAEEWSSRLEKDYFAKLPGGKYARFKIRFYPSSQRNFVVIESYINPATGSRNLEFDSRRTTSP